MSDPFFHEAGGLADVLPDSTADSDNTQRDVGDADNAITNGVGRDGEFGISGEVPKTPPLEVGENGPSSAAPQVVDKSANGAPSSAVKEDPDGLLPTQKGEVKNGWRLAHQLVAMQVDFSSRTLNCMTELVFHSTSAKLPKEVVLSCCQCHIDRVFLNGNVTDFKKPSFALAEECQSPEHHTEVRKKLLSSSESDGHQLTIPIPTDFQPEMIPTDQNSSISVPSTEPSQSASTHSTVWEVRVRIYYRLVKPVAGVHFISASAKSDSLPHLFADNHANSARYWMPCVDKLSERCTWELQFIVPRTAQDAGWQPLKETDRRERDEDEEDEEGDDEELDEGDEDEEEEGSEAVPDITVVCVGELVEHSLLPDSPAEKLFRFRVDTKISASSVLFAVGPFDIHEITLRAGRELDSNAEASQRVPDEDVMENDDNLPAPPLFDKCAAFYLPTYESELKETTRYIPKALSFLEQYIDVPYPVKNLVLIFVEDSSAPVIVGSGVCILSVEILYGGDIIDEVYLSQRYIVGCIAAQWFGQTLFYKNSSDVWLILGLQLYVTGLFLERIFGTNEYKFRLKRDMNRLYELDIHQPPLCPDPSSTAATIRSSFRPKPGEKRTNASMSALAAATESAISAAEMDPLWVSDFNPYDEWGSVRARFLALKAPLVLHMLDRRMGPGCLQKVIKKAIESMSPLGVTTQTWMKHCKKISGKVELRHFADQWLFGSGCPRFEFKFRFNRKRLMVEVFIRQENSNAGNPGATEKFTGPFMVRVHEPKGITYDTQLNIEDVERQYDIQYHTKYKRSGQKLKKLKRLGINTGAGGEDVNDEMEVDEREELANAERGPDLDQFDRRSLDWIRWDPENDWVCFKDCEQLQSMWIDQLSRDVDVAAQYEALTALTGTTDLTIAALTRVLRDERYFYRLRMEAAFSLVKGSNEAGSNEAVGKVFDFYMERFCFPKAAGSNVVIPRPNKFTVFQDYYIQKAIPLALSIARDSSGGVPLNCKRFILDLLRFNDNTQNEYSDCYFVSTLVNALCNCFLPLQNRSTDEGKRKGGEGSNMEGLVEELEGNDGVYEEDPEEVHPTDHFGSEENRALFEDARQEILRYLTLDPLLASYHNLITVSCLSALTKWTVAGLIPTDLEFFLPFTRPGNFSLVRQRSLDAILVLDGLRHSKVLHYFLAIVGQDPSPRIRFHMARCLAEYALLASGEVLNIPPKTKEQDNENVDGLGQNAGPESSALFNEEALARRQSEWKQLRKRLVADTALGSKLWRLLLEHPDRKVKAYLLKFAEVLYDPYVPPPPPPQPPPPPRLPPPRLPSPTPPLHHIPPDPVYDTLVVAAASAPVFTQPEKRTEEIDVTTLDPPQPTPPIINKPTSPPPPPIKPKLVLKVLPTSLPDSGKQQVDEKRPKHEELMALDEIFSPILDIDSPTIQPSVEHIPSTIVEAPTQAVNSPLRIVEPDIYPAPRSVEPSSKSPKPSIPALQANATDPMPTLVAKPPRQDIPAAAPIVKDQHTPAALAIQPATQSGEPSKKIRKIVLTRPKPAEPKPKVKHDAKEDVKQEVKQEVMQVAAEKPLTALAPIATPPPPVSSTSAAIPKADADQFQKSGAGQSQKSGGAKPTKPEKELKTGPPKSSLSSLGSQLLLRLERHPSSGPFLHPVDDIIAPGYSLIIKKPMDLSTARKSLLSGLYLDDAEKFLADLILLFQNCYTYNTDDSPVSMLAKNLELEFRAAVKALFPEHMASVDSGLHRVVVPPLTPAGPGSRRVSVSSTGTLKPGSRGGTPKPQTPALTGGMSESDYEKCMSIFTKLALHRASEWFQVPVDPVALNLPDYFSIIKKPMDLSTLRTKLTSGELKTPSDFSSTARLIFKNACTYNPPTTQVHQDAVLLRELLQKEFDKAFAKSAPKKAREGSVKKEIKQELAKPFSVPSKGADPGAASGPLDVKACRKLLKTLKSQLESGWFLQPVDPVALNIPTYFDVIKKPMDFSTLQSKLDAGEFGSVSDFLTAAHLIFRNATTFNPPVTQVHKDALKMRALLERESVRLGLSSGAGSEARGAAATATGSASSPSTTAILPSSSSTPSSSKSASPSVEAKAGAKPKPPKASLAQVPAAALVRPGSSSSVKSSAKTLASSSKQAAVVPPLQALSSKLGADERSALLEVLAKLRVHPDALVREGGTAYVGSGNISLPNLNFASRPRYSKSLSTRRCIPTTGKRLRSPWT
ncbi:hypothetical protein DFJ73DRAFT_814560 [Zopfochytrium polystomum]|nr:hypothetical protein DFJ73DRAFT_814560 [Zopfochytrium polystomum]